MTIKGRPESQRPSESLQVRVMNPWKTSPSLSLCVYQLFSLLAFTGSPHYSEDFEEEEDGKEPHQVCTRIIWSISNYFRPPWYKQSSTFSPIYFQPHSMTGPVEILPNMELKSHDRCLYIWGELQIMRKKQQNIPLSAVTFDWVQLLYHSEVTFIDFFIYFTN